MNILNRESKLEEVYLTKQLHESAYFSILRAMDKHGDEVTIGEDIRFKKDNDDASFRRYRRCGPKILAVIDDFLNQF